jgi:transcriptional regulator with GAF, ATPase, and Fis domain
MPLTLQPKLLRVLEDGSMRRIGSSKERHVHVRIIAATNRDLADDVKEGKFREDLYYRVNVLPIYLPPLRERPGDVEMLLDYFLPKGWHIDPEARQALINYPWPGNVRELINVVQRATILADREEITTDDLPREITDSLESLSHPEVAPPPEPDAPAFVSLGDRLDDVAKAHVMEVLQREGGNKARAARVLGIHRRKLYRLLERFAEAEKKSAS